MADKKLYGFTFIDEDGNENFIEIPAYSMEQAKYILGIDNEKILDVECTVKKYARA